MSNIDKLLYIDGIGEITQNLNIGGNLNVTNNINIGETVLSSKHINAGQNSTIIASNFNVGTKNIISASGQVSCIDLEVKNQGNIGLLVDGQSGDVQISGTLDVDTINEITTNAGVTIEGVLLKDNNLNVSGIGTITTINSTNITGDVTGNITSDTTISGLLSITKENTNNIRIDNNSGDIIYDVASGNEHIFDINGVDIARFSSSVNMYKPLYMNSTTATGEDLSLIHI